MPCLKIPATMDETEFKNEVRRLRPQLMVAARRHTGDSDCAEDIVQDALLRLWQLHANLHMPIAPLAFVLVRNLAIDTLRRHKRTTPVETLAMAEPVKEVDARYERIVRLLNKLPTLQQTIFRLRHIPDFVTFSKYVCKCLIISGCFCCLGRRAKSRVK